MKLIDTVKLESPGKHKQLLAQLKSQPNIAESSLHLRISSTIKL